LAIDSVCGMTVDEKSKYKEDWKGETYFFCSASCLARFRADPSKFVK
jgi:Cu+-exporting ATPase